MMGITTSATAAFTQNRIWKGYFVYPSSYTQCLYCLARQALDTMGCIDWKRQWGKSSLLRNVTSDKLTILEGTIDTNVAKNGKIPEFIDYPS